MPNNEHEAKWVDLVKYDPVTDKSQVLVKCVLEDGKLHYEGDATFAERHLAKGIYSAAENRLIMPDEGEPFLRSLQYEFHAPQFFATGVNEGAKPTDYAGPTFKDVDDRPAVPRDPA